MGKNTLMKLRGWLFLLIFIWLAWSSWRLMGDPEQVGVQIGFGLGYFTFILYSVQKRIFILKDKKIPKIKLNKMKKDFKSFYSIYAILFGIFTSLLFILNSTREIPSIISCIWLFGLILIAQGACFLYLVQYLDKHKPENLLKIFWLIFLLTSIIFGWISAQIAYFILKIPMADDLFTVTYGQIVLPLIFIIYFDYVFDYESKNSFILKDIAKVLNN